MLKDLVIVVAGSTADSDDARALAAEVERQGLRSWFLDDAPKIGDSRIGAVESAVQEAGALVLVRTGGAEYEPWGALQQKAFQIKNRFTDGCRIFVLPRGAVVLEATLLAHSQLLPQDLEPRAAATLLIRRLREGAPAVSSDGAAGFDAAPLIAPGAWTQASIFAHTYPTYADTILNLATLEEYEAANALYWKVLYFSGYREHWDRRLQLTELLVDLSRRHRDTLNVGMLLLKGLSYAFIERKQLHLAMHSIHRAHRIFQECGNRWAQALCWDYVGEVYSSLGQQSKAVRAYDRAIQGLRGLTRDHVTLRRWFLLAANADLRSRQREAELRILQSEFASVCNFRKGLVSIELARGLAARGGLQDAGIEAQEAVKFFRDTAGMPRYLARAEQLLGHIQGGNARGAGGTMAKVSV